MKLIVFLLIANAIMIAYCHFSGVERKRTLSTIENSEPVILTKIIKS